MGLQQRSAGGEAHLVVRALLNRVPLPALRQGPEQPAVGGIAGGWPQHEGSPEPILAVRKLSRRSGDDGAAGIAPELLGLPRCVQSAACRSGQRRCISSAAQRGSPRAAQRRAAARCGEVKQLAIHPGAPSATR